MTIKSMVEKIEIRISLMNKYPVYDGNTYLLCKSFQTLYSTGLMSERVYNKYIDVVLDAQNKLMEYYKRNNMTEGANKFFSIIWK